MTNSPASAVHAPAVPPAATGPRFAGLDGLRAIAVCVVLLFHLSPGFAPGGFLGVDIFFVLSGFLITALLLREKARHGHIRLGNFWRRRARRLLPALGTLLLVCCSAAWLVGGDVLVGLGRQLLGAVTFGSNWLAIADGHSYFDDTSPELFRNLWSLAVEEQFYLLWPLAVLLLLLVRSRRVRLALVAAAAAASGLAMALAFAPGGDATRVYYGTDTHSFGLALGAVLAILVHDWPGLLERPRRMRVLLQWVGAGSVAALLAASVFLTAEATITYRGGLAAVAVLTVLAIAGSIVPASRLGRYLDVAPLRWVGERSYGLYLWHWPVFVLLAAAAPDWSRSGPAGWALGGLALAMSLAAAAASYRYVEQPIRRNGFRAALRTARRWAPSSRLRLAGVGAVALLVVGGGISTATAIVNDPGVSDAQAEIEHGQAVLAAPRMLTAPSLSVASASWVSRPAPPVPSVPGPVVPSLPSGSEITAIGDSVMLASAPELQGAFPGIQIDAVVSRQLSEAPKLIRGMLKKGTLRDTVLLGLGTNGPIDKKTLEDIRTLATPARHIVVVNVQAPRGWTPRVNESLSLFAQRYRGVELANWRDAISGHLRYLAGDQIHPGPRGGRIYVSAVRDALQRLAESQVFAPNGYRLAPIPR